MPRLRCLSFLPIVAVLLTANSAFAQFGAVLSGAGPVDRSMAGASVAAPLSPAGAIYWNPATLSGLDRSELEAGAEVLNLTSRLESRVPAGTFGPGVPPDYLAGSTRSDAGPYALPTIALAYVPENSQCTYGLGVFSMAGFGVNYAGSALANPVLTAPPPAGLGFGSVYSQYQVLQITPSMSYRVSDKLSIGGGLSLDMANLQLDPGVFAPPDNANGDPFATYPSGAHGRTAWGGGFTLGVYYHEDVWALGASLRSPQWFETFKFNSANELGQPRELSTKLNQPMMVSVGGAYTGIERWMFAADVRYLDYANTDGFGDKGFAADDSLRGLGWRSIFAVALGAQYQATDRCSLRAGYSWNQNPVPDNQTFVNVASPVITKQMVFAGASWSVTDDLTFSFAYMHGFDNSVEGNFITPLGTVPGTTARSTLSLDSIMFSMSVKFGAKTELVQAMPAPAVPLPPIPAIPTTAAATPTPLGVGGAFAAGR
jgi:long-chain fatty acid transport protein